MANERLREAMLKVGLSTYELADKLDVNAKTVERWITLDRVPYPRHRHALAAVLQEREAYLWPNAVTPERAVRVAESELVHVYPRRAAIPFDVWTRLIQQSTEEIGILVYAGLFLPEQVPTLIKDLRAKAQAGTSVRILLGDPESEAVAARGAEEGIGDAMAGKVRNVLAFYNQLRGVPGVFARYHGTTLYNSMYRFDDELLVNTHAYGFPAAHAPVLHLRRLSAGELFDTYADSFDRVWSSGRPIWPAAVAA
ncbi:MULTISPECIES: multiprotein-bridging factor 1 family protein [unclassified Micromonospora]|uniref:helix-turn-helix domain-containing protein n=1 Tax=unclassified Micromonospora TaxID=2617518 RepID=UPI0036450A9F